MAEHGPGPPGPGRWTIRTKNAFAEFLAHRRAACWRGCSNSTCTSGPAERPWPRRWLRAERRGRAGVPRCRSRWIGWPDVPRAAQEARPSSAAQRPAGRRRARPGWNAQYPPGLGARRRKCRSRRRRWRCPAGRAAPRWPASTGPSPGLRFPLMTDLSPASTSSTCGPVHRAGPAALRLPTRRPSTGVSFAGRRAPGREDLGRLAHISPPTTAASLRLGETKGEQHFADQGLIEGRGRVTSKNAHTSGARLSRVFVLLRRPRRSSPRSDIDANGHVNNVSGLVWAHRALGCLLGRAAGWSLSPRDSPNCAAGERDRHWPLPGGVAELEDPHRYLDGDARRTRLLDVAAAAPSRCPGWSR